MKKFLSNLDSTMVVACVLLLIVLVTCSYSVSSYYALEWAKMGQLTRLVDILERFVLK